VDSEGMKAIFMKVDETRNSILAKQKRLQSVLEAHPDFREGLNQLAICRIQLNRAKEAIQLLKRYHDLDNQNPTVEYYLAVLHAERYDFKSAWQYLANAEKITVSKNYFPKVLKELKKELRSLCPQSQDDLNKIF
jgi:predicted Zn-dependent protease